MPFGIRLLDLFALRSMMGCREWCSTLCAGESLLFTHGHFQDVNLPDHLTKRMLQYLGFGYAVILE